MDFPGFCWFLVFLNVLGSEEIDGFVIREEFLEVLSGKRGFCVKMLKFLVEF
jgi:hypothetical protein